MNKKLIQIIISFIFFLYFWFFLLGFIPESHCADYWKSNSIGKSGACSWHGGVVDYEIEGMIIFIISILVGFMVYSFLNILNSKENLEKIKNYLKFQFERSSDFLRCPKGIFISYLILLLIGLLLGSLLGGRVVYLFLFQENNSFNSQQKNYHIDKDSISGNYSNSNKIESVEIQNIDNIGLKDEQIVQDIFPKVDFDFENQPYSDIAKFCGEGGFYSDILGKCSCNPGFGISSDGLCVKKYCGDGGLFSDILLKCSCNPGYGLSGEGVCEKKECENGGIYSEISNSCIVF